MIAIDLDDLPFQVAIVSRSRVSLRNWLPRPLKKMLYTKGTCKSSTFSKTPMLATIYIIIYIYPKIEDVQSYVQSVNQKVDKKKCNIKGPYQNYQTSSQSVKKYIQSETSHGDPQPPSQW